MNTIKENQIAEFFTTDQLTKATKEVSETKETQVYKGLESFGFTPFVEIAYRTQDDVNYFHFTEICVTYKGRKFKVSPWLDNRNSFYASDIINDANVRIDVISHSLLNETRNKHLPKRAIGKLDGGKLDAYFEGLYNSALELDAIILKNTNKGLTEYNKLNDAGAKFWNVKKTAEGNISSFEGQIIKNGIQLSFEYSNGYLHTKIEVYYEANRGLDTFLALSDNKYKPSK